MNTVTVCTGDRDLCEEKNVNPVVKYVGNVKSPHMKLYPNHRHSYYEILLLIRGSGKITIDNKQHLVTASSLIVFDKNASHAEEYYADIHGSIETYFIAFNIDNIRSLSDMEQHTSERDIILTLSSQDLLYIKKLFTRIESEISDTLPGYMHMCNILCSEMVMYIERRLIDIANGTKLLSVNPKNECANIIKEYLENNFHKDITIASIALELHISYHYANHIFKQAFGTAPYQYVTRLRIDRAAKLLTTTNTKVNAIAQQCGYDNITLFYKNFKKEKGCTPSQYRERAGFDANL